MFFVIMFCGFMSHSPLLFVSTFTTGFDYKEDFEDKSQFDFNMVTITFIAKEALMIQLCTRLLNRKDGSFSSFMDLSGILKCPTCLELLFAPVVLNCSHNFCLHCIGEWKESRKEEVKTCPSCRKMIESENRVLDKILEMVESEMDKKEDKDKSEEQKRKHTQFMENHPRQIENAITEQPLVNPVIKTATTEFVISNGRLAQARIQFDSGHDIIYKEGNSGFDTFRNAFNSDQDYQDFDADLQMQKR